MNILELILTAVGLAMDAFAVSVCKGLAVKSVRARHMIIAGAWFGGFQALMPLLGYWLGGYFLEYIEAFDHWIAFTLLLLIGLNMIREAFSKEENGGASSRDLGVLTMLLLAVATSIDALAVGITLAFLEVQIIPAILLIGGITFVISAAGIKIGSLFGSRYKTAAEIVGGIILVILGTKILLEHLHVI